jgi:HD-GYP domain-containing protein (c-di-GMP phosphodiesterase class II)
LVARIIGLADAFDAMTSDRPYRKAMPVDIALSEIKRGSGLQFDPELCLLFAEMIYSDCKLFDQSSSLPPSA